MIFDTTVGAFESEKERNLYTKFFAGYFLNEFIDGYETRVKSLNKLLSQKLGKEIALNNPHVSFDNHEYLLNTAEGDKGEFADVLLHDIKHKVMITIEVKFLTGISTEKDCEKNLERINRITKKWSELEIHFILLISEKKWNAAKDMKNHPNSNFTRYEEKHKDKIRMLFWEELLPLCNEEKVINFMKERLKLVNAPESNRLCIPYNT
jgi:hypothetical protein